MTTEQKFNCIFCKDVFDNKEELQVHFRKHADPRFKSNNRFELDNEPNVSIEKVKEKSEMVSCDVCSQMFPTISKAITHKHKVHPDHDVKYFCPWCGKLFTMKHPYSVHIQTSHESQKQDDDKIFHCDCCDVDFFLPSAMLYHNKFFHRQDSDVTDVGSSKKLKLYNQEILQLYYCAFCGEEYENKVNLMKHTTDDHSDENQSPDEVLRCPLCEAIFYHLDAYEIHLSFHSTDDLYSATNELFANLLDFSLETVPPIIETVDNRECFEPEALSQDTADADSTANTLEIEKFLELAMGKADGDGMPVKVKKKKHKKSKKSAAITLDEFLNMNQDVFGEGLDFQGVEEVPTRVVTKQLKSKKSANLIASAELEKLKEKGIVVMKVGASKPTKLGHRKITKKTPPNRELKTSSEVLTKLINQSNNQIKIVKRSIVQKNDVEQIQNSTAEESNVNEKESDRNNDYAEDTKHASINKEETTSTEPDYSIKEYNNSPSSKMDESKPMAGGITSDIPVDRNADTSHNRNETDDETGKESNCTLNSPNGLEQISKVPSTNLSSKLGEGEGDVESANDINNKNDHSDQSDYEEADSEIDDKKSNTDHFKDTDEHINKIQSLSNKNNPQSNNNPVASLSTLKHLSHLTVKPINQNKNISIESTKDKISETKNDKNADLKKDNDSPRPTVSTNNEIIPAKSKPTVDKDPTLDALKMLSKNITIKSLTPSTKRSIEETESDYEDDGDTVTQKPTNNIKPTDITANKTITMKKIKPDEPSIDNKGCNSKKNIPVKKFKIEKDEPIIDTKDVSSNKNITIKKIKVDKDEPSIGSKVISTQNNTVNNTTKIVNKMNTTTIEMKSSKTNIDNIQNNLIKTNNANILKHLPNIITKPLVVKEIVQSQDVKQSYAALKEAEVIEISDIDDSDDDTGKQFEPKQDATKSTDPLRNLSKHITVKSLNQPVQPLQKIIKVEKVEEPDHYEDQCEAFDFNDDIPNTKVCSQKLSSRNMAFKNALKNLGKNITVKSRTSSPSQSVKSQDHNSQDINEYDMNDADSDIDLDTGKVKITEINNDNHDENFDEMDDCDPDESGNNPIVESPHDSCSDHDEIDDTDFESEIKATTLQKTSHEITMNKNNVCLNNLKNISKSITIKSLNSNTIDTQVNPKPTQSQENLEVTKNQTKQLTIKPSPQTVKETRNENTSNSTNFKKMGDVVDHTSNESLNQKVSVNKEVTVKTFQTKTVIQEITTTVTKTIKTVNQTVNKQEARNSSQMNMPTLPQKVLGMRPPNTSKNLQGVVIRHAAPVVCKPSNAGTQFRPVGSVVRHSKQIVPMRPALNVTRPNTPRKQSPKTNLPKSSPNQPVIGRPLKFSPSVLTSSLVKRPNTEEASGPFSCFKKPKESLIPVSDIPTFAGDSTVQMNAASHTSTSNYTSTSKIVKGNSVVTATQMKSEVTSMQQQTQFSRHGNTIGTKVKNVQVKHSQVQEKSDSSAMKRTTLAAIEKLQKQGLLIKKPRVEVNENSDSEHIDDNVGYSSPDELET